MQKIIIVGGKKINGTVNITGSKNDTLSNLAASIINKNRIVINNIHVVKDVETMINMLALWETQIK